MRGWGMVLVTLTAGWLMIGSTTALAQKTPAQKRDEQRENEAVREAQRELQEARNKLKDAEKSLKEEQASLQKSLAAQKTAAAAVQKVQDRLETEHGERVGLTAARVRLKEAQVELDRASQPVLERVRTEQRTLVEAVERARQSLRPTDDESSPARRAAVEEHARLTKQLRDAERTALEADPTARPLLERVAAAQTAVQAAVRKFDAAVERDAELKGARQALEKSQRDVATAETAIAKATRAVADARGKVAQATQKLQQKQAADARDKNQPKKPRKGK